MMASGGWRRRATALAARFARARRGNVAMIFALCLPILLMMTLGGVDIHRASTARMTLQDALDAAALAAARSPYTEAEDLTRVGDVALRANLQSHPGMADDLIDVSFTLNANQVVIADAKVNLKTLVANVFLPPYGKLMDDRLPVGAHSEVNRSSKNIEVALVLDVTGSMRGTRLTNLKAAAKELVEIVVQPLQTPYYSRVAIIPYSAGVTLGDYADAARGVPVGPTPITAAAWAAAQGKSISDITRASPGVVTASNHGFVNGDTVWISGVEGMHQINDRAYRVVRIDNNKFSLQTTGGVAVRTRSQDGYSAYSRRGQVRKCQRADCSVQITSSGHGLQDGEGVYITDVRGMSGLNDEPYLVANRTANTFEVAHPGGTLNDYTSGGQAWCGRHGCQRRVFVNTSNTLTMLEATTATCASERVGAQAYTDAAPTTARVAFNYDPSNNRCPYETIQPLTADKTVLTTLIDSMVTSGSTAGQIGTAWGWYAVSPNFNALWPSNGAGAYNANDVLKAVVIMTDGEFNTNHCEGVLARNADYTSAVRINCNATNGSPYDQTESLCAAMRAQGVIVYTVGFQMNANGRGARTLATCATSGEAFLPASGADLSDAFKAIGRDITRLRISK